MRRAGGAADSGERSSAPRASRKLDPLLRPSSIAIVGASGREGSFGARLLQAVSSERYKGRVYPVNPRYDELAGVKCYSSISAIPERPDLVAFALSDDLIENALIEAAEAGVPAAAIFGRAYEPVTPGKKSKVERLAAIARSAGMVVCGNNCMGFINFVDGLKVSGNPPPIPEVHGSVGLISHSGSTWSGLIGNQRQLAFNYAISAGQEIATNAADYMDFLLDQQETRVIACILETVRDPERFLAAIERADRQGVPVVALKLGRSEHGRKFALAHSGALAGSDAAYSAIFERHNVVRVYSVDELTDTLELFNADKGPTAGGIGIVTDSGGERELIVDIASDVNAPIAEIGSETSARLATVLDPGMAPVNPVDAYGDGRMLIEECLRILADDPNVGIVALATNLVHGRSYLYSCTAAVERAHAATEKPVIVFGNLHSTISREEAARLRGLGIPVLMGTPTALSAMKHVISWAENRKRRAGASRAISRPTETLALEKLSIAARTNSAIPPEIAFGVLKDFGIPTAATEFVEDADSAGEAALRIGFPAVLKTASPEILHKTEMGGVVAGLTDSDAVRKAYSSISSRCGPRVQVQAQVDGGVEVLLGMTNDPQFGPMVTVGLGGIFTELLGDVVTICPPIAPSEAEQYLSRLKGHRLLRGFRGRPPCNVESLCSVINGFANLCLQVAPTLEAIDINPVIVGPKSAVAVDVLMIPKKDH